MGDLFDGYGSTLAPRKTASGIPAFDEMFGVPSHPGDPAESREAYRELYQALAQMTQEELRGRTESLASSYLAQGVTFDFAGEERPFPLDAVPRVIDASTSGRSVEAGVAAAGAGARGVPRRRVRRQHCVRDGVIPAALITSSQYFHRQAAGIVQRERRAHPGVRHRPDPRRARRVARARGQRARAVAASATSSRTAG